VGGPNPYVDPAPEKVGGQLTPWTPWLSGPGASCLLQNNEDRSLNFAYMAECIKLTTYLGEIQIDHVWINGSRVYTHFTKLRITQTTSYDSPGSLVFVAKNVGEIQMDQLNSTQLNKPPCKVDHPQRDSAKCRWMRQNRTVFDQYLAICQQRRKYGYIYYTK